MLSLFFILTSLARAATPCAPLLDGHITPDARLPRVVHDRVETWPRLDHARPAVVVTREGRDELLAVDVGWMSDAAAQVHAWAGDAALAWSNEVIARVANYARFGSAPVALGEAVRTSSGVAAIHDLFFVRFVRWDGAASGRVALASLRPYVREIADGVEIPVIEALRGRQGDRRPGAWLMLPDPSLRPPAHHVYFAPDDDSTVDDFITATHTRAAVFRNYLHRAGAVRRAVTGSDVITLPAFSPLSFMRGPGSSPRLLRVRYERASDAVIVTIDRAAPATYAEIAIHAAEFARDHLTDATSIDTHVLEIKIAHGPLELRVPAILKATDVDQSLALKRVASSAARLLVRDPDLARRVIDLAPGARAHGSTADETRATTGTIRAALTTRGYTLIFGKDDRGGVNVLAWLYTGRI